MSNLIPSDVVVSKIYFIRGKKVMVDRDLAELYRVPTQRLNEQVKRNIERFPEDFMFELTKEEAGNLISHFAISSWGGTRKLPRVFTEQGIAMLSSVLKSKRAVQVNIAIMRAFVKLREMIASHKDLARKLEQLEKKYDAQFRIVFDAIRKLIKEDEIPKRGIGFHVR